MSKRLKFSMLITTIMLLISSNKIFGKIDLIPQQPKIIQGDDEKESDTHDGNELLKERMSIETVEDDKYKDYIEVNLVISHYTDLYGNITASGDKVRYGIVAIPRELPLGTKFILDGYEGEFVGLDYGSRKYIKWLDENTMKIDLFTPKLKNESRSEYIKRIKELGIKKTTGRYLIVEDKE